MSYNHALVRKVCARFAIVLVALVAAVFASTTASAAPVWYVDTDGDHWGNSVSTIISVTQPPATAGLQFDCDDFTTSVNPGALDVPSDSIDNNCNGDVDEPNSVLGPNMPGTIDAPFVSLTTGVGVATGFSITADDNGNNANVNFLSTVKPAGSSFTGSGTGNSVTGNFTWTPTITDLGTHKVEIYSRYFDTVTGMNGRYAMITVTPEPGVALCLIAFGGLTLRRRLKL